MLLLRYYGSKAGLFEAALREAMKLDRIATMDRASFGATIANSVSGTSGDLQALAMVALAIGDPESSTIAARVSETHVIEPLSSWLGPPDARARAIKITMLCHGFLVYTRQMPLHGAANCDMGLANWLATVIQDIVECRQA